MNGDLVRSSKYKFNLELKAPLNPTSLPAYYEKIKHLFALSRLISIASKPSKSISGFDKCYNLASYLLAKEQDNLDILFHLTCNDLNKVNIGSRLKLLKLLNIKRVLVVTGDDYQIPTKKAPTTSNAQQSAEPQHQQKIPDDDLFFLDSTELTKHLIANYPNWFDSIGVAAYPGGNGLESKDDLEELERLRDKLALGVDTVYTQCIFEPEIYAKFQQTFKTGGQFKSIQIVPSVALFDDTKQLEIVSKLTRVSLSPELISGLGQSEASQLHGGFSKQFIANLCRSLQNISQQSTITIDLCTFGHFELARDLINELNCNDEGCG